MNKLGLEYFRVRIPKIKIKVTERFKFLVFPLIAKKIAYSSSHAYPASVIWNLAKAFPLPAGT